MWGRLWSAFGDFSIKRKLTLIITGTSAVSLLLACAGFVANDVQTFRTATQEKAITLTTIVANNLAAALNFNDAAAAQDILASLSEEPHVISATVYRGGVPLANYVRPGGPHLAPATAPTTATHRLDWRRDQLEVVRAVRWQNETLGTLYVAEDLGLLHQQLVRLGWMGIALLVTATLAAYALSARFQRIVSRPVLQLVELARHVSAAKDYRVRAPVHARDEIGQLFDGFNHMLGRIQERDEALLQAQAELEQRVAERTRELSRQVAERIAAEKALHQQLTRMSLLNQIASAISDRQTMDRIADIVLSQLELHLPVAFGSVLVCDAAGKTLAPVASRGGGPGAQPRSAGTAAALAPIGPLPGALAGLEACSAGQQLYVPDTTAVAAPLLQRFARAGVLSIVALPLIVERRLFGVLLVGRHARQAFTSGEGEFLRMLAEQVAIAGHQAQLYSELQRAYTELRESQRAMMQQERLRALGQMASGVAHDINNSLTPVVTYCDLLLARPAGLDEKTRNYLEHIRTAGVDIAGIVARLRDFYRPRDRAEAFALVDLNRLLQQVAELTRPRWRDMPQARGAVIQLQFDLTEALPPLEGNETELREAVTNLVLNAVDAMPQGGILSLRTRSPQKNEIAIEVADTGVGMDEDTKSRCLEPFFSTKGQLGTGLGLAMVYGVVERHGGRTEIDTAPGAGTTMRLCFAVTHGKRSPLPAPVERQPVRACRVLCIDDEPVLRSAMEEMLRMDGHEVVTAQNGADGLAAWEQARARGEGFDLVFTDLGMPHMDGHEVARRIKAQAPAAPVILLTGWGKILQEDGAARHVDAVLTKPPRVAEVRSAMRAVIRV